MSGDVAQPTWECRPHPEAFTAAVCYGAEHTAGSQDQGLVEPKDVPGLSATTRQTRLRTG